MVSDKSDSGEEIPVFKSWSAWYTLVLAILIFEIVLFQVITLLLS